MSDEILFNSAYTAVITYRVLCRLSCGHLRVRDRCTDADPVWYVIWAVHTAQNNQLLFR
jgi:hypothetical protein